MIELAWTVLWLSPVVALLLFRNLVPPLALSVTIVGAYLLLPSGLGVDLPVLPRLNRNSVIVVSAFVLTALAVAQPQYNTWRRPGWMPSSPGVLLLLLLLVLGFFGTVLTNPDPLIYGWRYIPGLRIYDAFSEGLGWFVLLIPFFVGRMLLSTPKAQKTLLQVIVIAALIYSLPVLWEVRMSPQLHRQIYGFSPFSFAQQMRGSGFRPVVFLNHGLALSFFLTLSVIAAAALWRAAEKERRRQWGLSMLWLFAVLVLTKSLGAVLIAILLVPAVMFLKTRTQLLMAFCIAGTVLTYPVLRAADLVPVDRVVAMAADISPRRAESLRVRIYNEDNLLAHAKERPLWGWGSWGRQRIYNEAGTDISLTDGYWVILLGQGGWVRYLAVFGLLCWPLIMLFLRRREPVDPISIGLVFMLCAKLIDFIPNAGMIPLVWLITGALVGGLERRVQDGTVETVAEAAPAAEGPVYTRQKLRHSRYAREDKEPQAQERKRRSYARTEQAQEYRR